MFSFNVGGYLGDRNAGDGVGAYSVLSTMVCRSGGRYLV